MRKILSYLLIIILFSAGQAWALAVYPGAEGYGTQWSIQDWSDDTPDIYFVRTLSPDVARQNCGGVNGLCAIDERCPTGEPVGRQCGTNYQIYEAGLRTAFQASGAKVIIPEISGNITLTGAIAPTSYTEFWGGSGPAPGLYVRHNAGTTGFNFESSGTVSYVMTQHLRVRGDCCRGGDDSGSMDGIAVTADAAGEVKTYLVFSHVSSIWSTDGDFDMREAGAGQIENVTLIDSIIAETLNTHAFLGLMSGNETEDGSRNMSYIRTVWANYESRGPLMGNGIYLSKINNLNYNATSYPFSTSTAAGSPPGGKTNFVENLGIRGNIGNYNYIFRILSATHDDWEVYYNGNLCNAGTGSNCLVNSNPNVSVTAAGAVFAMPNPITILSTAGTLRSNELYDYLMEYVGPWPQNRDAADTRILNNIANNTGSLINDPDTDTPEQHETLATNYTNPYYTLPEDPWGDSDLDGYTNLEEQVFTEMAETNGESIPPETYNASEEGGSITGGTRQ